MTADKRQAHGDCPGPLRIEVSPSGRASFCACPTCHYVRLTVGELTISAASDLGLQVLLMESYTQLVRANGRNRAALELKRIADLVLGDPTP